MSLSLAVLVFLLAKTILKAAIKSKLRVKLVVAKNVVFIVLLLDI